MAYCELQKTQYYDANTSLQSLLFRGLADQEFNKARNIFEERAMHYSAMNGVLLFKHILDLYDWVSDVMSGSESRGVDSFID